VKVAVPIVTRKGWTFFMFSLRLLLVTYPVDLNLSSGFYIFFSVLGSSVDETQHLVVVYVGQVRDVTVTDGNHDADRLRETLGLSGAPQKVVEHEDCDCFVLRHVASVSVLLLSG
jgi:hypothetical protein